MTSTQTKTHRLSCIEECTLRPYFVASVCCNAIQVVVKIASAAFSALMAGLTLGQSSTMNKWFVAHAKDCWLSMKMTAFSAAGIAIPKLGVKLTESIDHQGVEELASFKTNDVVKATFIERCGMRVQFVANTIKEMFCTLICSVRYLLSLVLKWVNFGRSYYFDQISFHEFFLFSGHLTCTFNSINGVINPKNVTLKMVQG